MDIEHFKYHIFKSEDSVSVTRVTLDVSSCPPCPSLISSLSTPAFQFCRSTAPCMFEIVFGYPGIVQRNKQTDMSWLTHWDSVHRKTRLYRIKSCRKCVANDIKMYLRKTKRVI